jgi:hypothetical protein
MPYAIAAAMGMEKVANAQYRGERLMDLIVVDAFSQDGGAGNGGGLGTGNGGAATDGGSGGGSATVPISGGFAAGPKVVMGNGWVGMSRGAAGGSPSDVDGVHGWGRSGSEAPTWL